MLRTLLLVCAGALALLGARLLFHGQTGGGLSAFGAGVVLLIGTVFERRYRSAAARPGAAWQPTGERFEDPQSGKTVAVLYDPVSGARRYIDDPQPPPGGG